MKAIKIQYFFLTTIIYFLVKQILENGRIISNIIQSIVFSVLFWLIKGIYTRRMQKEISEVDNYLGQKVISCSLVNHSRGIIADGGVGYLLQDRLVFIPHKLNLSKKQLDIQFCDMERIAGYKILGIFDTGLRIEMKSGKVEKFVVDKTNSFYKNIIIRHNN